MSGPHPRPEMRYGCPAADQILINRFYSVGYSYYFRQAKWALEIVDPDKKDMEEVERLDNFRPDYRVPKQFRADLSDYRSSGFDRGHLVASANLNDEAAKGKARRCWAACHAVQSALDRKAGRTSVRE